MTRILIATWDGGGNVPPALNLAAELRHRGHAVRVIGHPGQQAAVAERGLEFRPFPTAASFDGTRANSLMRMIGLFTDRAIGRDVVTEAERMAADVVVVDCLLLGAMRACAAAGLDYVSLEHLYDGYLRGSWLHGPVGLTGWSKGLRPTASWNQARHALAATLADLDPAAARGVPANLTYTGPLQDVPAPHDLGSHAPAVLISLSTFNYPGMTACLQKLLDATAQLEARVVMTTGPVVDPEELRTAPHQEVHRYVDHDELMPRMSLLVGHGGHATTMRALAHDLPVLVMPMSRLLDQPLVGRSVATAGAGRLLSRRAGTARVRTAIESLLADGPHRVAAARLGARIRAAEGTRTAADLVLDRVASAI